MWALPAILPQLIFGADLLWHYRRLVFLTIFVPGTYLSLMDIVALTDTTWSISPGQTTGVLFFGILPLEEVVFFFITNVLIGFGLTLMLAEAGQVRVQAWKSKFFPGNKESMKIIKRIRRNPDVKIAPSKADGTPLAEWVAAKASSDDSPAAIDHITSN
jgi:lycopene cyclase domain-containing protein